MKARNPMRQSWLGEGETEGWIAHRLELVTSPAWRLRPKPLANILDRLEIEHMREGGKANGNLCVSYDQFVAAGVSRKVIRAAEDTGEALGLLVVERSQEMVGNIRGASKYRLTYVPAKDKRAPTDEWRDVTAEQAKTIVADFQIVASQKRGPSYPQGTQPSSPFGQTTARKAANTSSPFGQTPVTQGEHPSISATSNPDDKPPGSAAPANASRAGGRVTSPDPEPSKIIAYRMGESPPAGSTPLGPQVNTRTYSEDGGPIHLGQILQQLRDQSKRAS